MNANLSLADATVLIKKLLRRPVAYHRAFCEMTGKACAGVMLSQAWYWSSRTEDDDGWFYKTSREWRDETGLSRTEQETARKRLVGLGLMEEKERGMPCTMHFRVNVENVVAQLVENPHTVSRQELRKLVSGKPANIDAENPHTVLIERVPETTYKESTGESAPAFNQSRSATLSTRSGPTRIDSRPKKIPLPIAPDPATTKMLNEWGAKMGFGFGEMEAMWRAFRLKHLDERTTQQTDAEWLVKFQRYVANCNVTKTQRQRPA